MARMRRSGLLAAGLLAALAGSAPLPARADTVTLRNGKTVEGLVLEETPERLVLRTPAGSQTLARATVASVAPSADPQKDFDRYFALLGKKDAQGAFLLGDWARRRGFEAGKRRGLERALAIDPDHARAREALGFVRVDGSWMTREQAAEHEKDEKLRGEMAERYGRLLGEKPETLLGAHWACVDLLQDGKAADRLVDLEQGWVAAVEVLGPPDPWPGRAKVLALKGLDQYRKWLDGEGGSIPGANAQLVGFMRQATGMKWTTPPILARSDQPDVPAMHSANVHAAGHLLLNNWKGYNRGNQPFWLEEGFGGWLEARVRKSNSSWCFEVKKSVYGGGFRNTQDWEKNDADVRALAKEAASKGGFLPLDQLDTLPKGEYGKREVVQSFTLVSFLLDEKGKERFRDYLTRVKGGTRSSIACKAAYDVDFEGLEKEWARYVVAKW